MNNFTWVHRQGVDHEGDTFDRYYLVDALSRKVLGHVDTPQYPYLCFRAIMYMGDREQAYVDLDSAKAYLEAEIMSQTMGPDYSDAYSADKLEFRYGHPEDEQDWKSRVKRALRKLRV